ncbi:hypothetical protein [Halobacterium litoreum]|uniref:Uncharacterized protein n=1 Tax=Halobacterium litoreum TaxID=2039234 RepID=A0ABD5NHA3_9EURY|nr:hypothetical protein [Halobacterium litoreum]UHH12759.1 hypothetical protein LT972_11380 [Halobacterium litoreum]
MALQGRHRRTQSTTDRDGRRIEVSEMTAAGVAAYADTHGDDAFLERRGGQTFLVTEE